MIRSLFRALLVATFVLGAGAIQAAAVPAKPGRGVVVVPVKSFIAEETFQTLLVVQALRDLGYEVRPIMELEYAAGHVAVAKGDATFMADHWHPLHMDFYDKAGGDSTLRRASVYSGGALQGYLIDRKTADKYGIKRMDQLRDPQLARLFDTDGDGKADLAGCNPGWGCAEVINHHLDAYGLRATVSHRQGSYAAIIAATIARYRQGKPVLYYTWTPYWVSGVLIPGEDVVWLRVPFSSLPGKRTKVSTALSNGADYGFETNVQQIVANRAWVEANPAAAKLFALMSLPADDISRQNRRMREGETSRADIARHMRGWIKTHRAIYDDWLAKARAAAE